MMKLVKFKDGRYGVQQRTLFFKQGGFFDKEGVIWHLVENINEYCKFTKEEAIELIKTLDIECEVVDE